MSKSEQIKCYLCKKPLIPDKKTYQYGTKKWDKRTFKWNCKCYDDKQRMFVP